MAFLSNIRGRIAGSRPESLTDILNRQIDVAIQAAELANEVCSKEAAPADSADPMKSLRSEGHDARRELMSTMASALTVPLEREDLFRASLAIENVISDLRDLIREMTWWELEGGKWSKEALAPAIDSLKELRLGVEVTDSADAEVHLRKARRYARELRRTYQKGLSLVFAEELTMTTLKKREILRRIDFIGLHLQTTAVALLDGMIKRYM